MKSETYSRLQRVGFSGTQDSAPEEAIRWLSEKNILRIEPYWRFLGSNGGHSWTKSWDEFRDKVEVECETWEELLQIALEKSVEEAQIG